MKNIYAINNILQIFKETFIAILPYVILSSIVVLFTHLFIVFDFSWGSINSTNIGNVSTEIRNFFPIILIVSLSYHLAQRSELPTFIFVSLVLFIFVSVEAVNGFNAVFLSFLIPFSSALILKYILDKHGLIVKHCQENYLAKTLHYLVAFILTYFISLFIYLVGIDSLSFYDFSSIFSSVDNDIRLFLRTLFGQILWFIGIHPAQTQDAISANYFFQDHFLNNLSYLSFYRLFVIVGGSGMALSLLLALYIVAKDKQSRDIAKIATPFVFFNISEILIFGIPIVFNRYLLIPFILVPLINAFIAYTALLYYPIHFVDQSISWITPVFINVYLLSDGNLFALALQLFLVLLGTFIYMPFVKKYTTLQSSPEQMKKLNKNLQMFTKINANKELKAHESMKKIIKSNIQLDGIINKLSHNTLKIYYQPKINIQTNECISYEALLRLQLEDGTVIGPYFLEDIERTGMASIIDLWVCQYILEDIKRWEKEDFFPQLSINLHPDTLDDNEIILKIIALLKGEKIDFELIERSELNSKESIQNLGLLKDNGFTLSLDDFGVGYSSLNTLITQPFETVKIDKSVIDVILQEKGYAVCKHISLMSSELNMHVIAEGVESKDQLLLLRKMGVEMVQGYIYSPALSFEHVQGYSPENIH